MNEIYLYKKNKKSIETINVGMAYPSTYYYGMSVLGYLSMFKEFDMNENVSAQRIFLNSKALAFNPKYLDMLGFSCVFELDILQILKILKKYNFQLEAQKRKRKTPLIFAGGPVITSNPEPFAEFFDFMIIGDGEGIANEITKVYLKHKNKTKAEILNELSRIDGIYVPSLYNVKYNNEKIKSFIPLTENIPRIITKRIANVDNCLFSPIISENTFYTNTVFIELSRGCPFECKFCTAHWQNMPMRFSDFKYVKKIIKKAVKYADKIVFIGAMISAHPEFDELCKYLIKLKEKRDFQVEFSSMSFEYPSKNITDLLNEKTISLSVECGTNDLRLKTGKILSDEKIYDVITYYVEKGITKFNLYYMIGLPNETQDDINNYIEFSLKLANDFNNVKFNHIISTFNPKPATPFERMKKESKYELDEKIEKIKNAFKDRIDFSSSITNKDAVNTLISLADRRLGRYIKHIFEKNTPLNDMLKEYKRFMKEINPKLSDDEKLVHYSKYIYREKTPEEMLPWGFIRF